MKKLLTILLALSLITGCSAGNTAPEGTVTDENDTTTSAKVKMAETITSSEASKTIPLYKEYYEPELIAIQLPADAMEQIEFDDIELLKFKYSQVGFVGNEADLGESHFVKTAINVLLGSNYYTEAVKLYNEQYSDEEIYKGMYADYFDGDTITPLYISSITEDFDGNGTKENFVVLSMPDYYWLPYVCYYIIFVNSNGEARIISSGYSASIGLIDYGAFKHLDIQYGHNNSTTKYEIFSVNGDGVKLEMRNCFRGAPILDERLMKFTAIQQCCEMSAFWDISDKCYKQLGGIEYDLETFKKYWYLDNGYPLSLLEFEIQNVCVFGNRYYVINTNNTFAHGVTYKNGMFSLNDMDFATTDGKYVKYSLDYYLEDYAPVPPVAYLDLSGYDEENS